MYYGPSRGLVGDFSRPPVCRTRTVKNPAHIRHTPSRNRSLHWTCFELVPDGMPTQFPTPRYVQIKLNPVLCSSLPAPGDTILVVVTGKHQSHDVVHSYSSNLNFNISPQRHPPVTSKNGVVTVIQKRLTILQRSKLKCPCPVRLGEVPFRLLGKIRDQSSSPSSPAEQPIPQGTFQCRPVSFLASATVTSFPTFAFLMCMYFLQLQGDCYCLLFVFYVMLSKTIFFAPGIFFAKCGKQFQVSFPQFIASTLLSVDLLPNILLQQYLLMVPSVTDEEGVITLEITKTNNNETFL